MVEPGAMSTLRQLRSIVCDAARYNAPYSEQKPAPRHVSPHRALLASGQSTTFCELFVSIYPHHHNTHTLTGIVCFTQHFFSNATGAPDCSVAQQHYWYWLLSVSLYLMLVLPARSYRIHSTAVTRCLRRLAGTVSSSAPGGLCVTIGGSLDYGLTKTIEAVLRLACRVYALTCSLISSNCRAAARL